MDSKVIDWLRFPLAVAIVFIHCKHYPINWSFVYANPLHSENILGLIHFYTANIIAPVAIQTFFVLSGFLFFNKFTIWNRKVFLDKLKKRVNTLLIPYILWTLIFIIIFIVTFKLFPQLIKNYSNINDFITANGRGWWHLFWDSEIAKTQKDILGIPYDTTFPAHNPLWYIRDLMVAVILSPIIFFIAKYGKKIGFIFFFIIYMLGIGNYLHGVSISSLFYFFWGAYISINSNGLVNTFSKYRKFAGILLPITLIGIYFINYFNTPDTQLLYFFAKKIQIVFAIALIVYLIPTVSKYIQNNNIVPNKWLSKTSFFIYAFHALFALQISELIMQKIIISQRVIPQIINYILSAVLCISISLTAYYILEHYFPKLLLLFTGNRNETKQV